MVHYICYVNSLEKHILPELEELFIEQVTTLRLEQFLMEKLHNGRLDGRGGLSSKTVADLRGVLRLILEYAQTHGCPDLDVRLPKVSGYTLKIQTLSHFEQQQLERFLFASAEPINLGILLSLYGGLRIGEVCALQWGDFQFQSGTVTVRKTLLRIRDLTPEAPAKTKLLLETPKTQCSNRIIPLPDFILAYFSLHQRAPNAYLLTGTPHFMEPRICLIKYKRVLAEAGVKDYTFHALRHTFATRCVENGVDIKSLSEIMGHASITITMQRYVHPSMELKRSQINKLTPFIGISPEIAT